MFPDLLKMTAQPLRESKQPNSVDNLRVVGVTRLITPAQIKEQLPAGETQLALVENTIREEKAILSGEDDRMLVIVGPCSIHDPASALEYARRLAVLSREVADR